METTKIDIKKIAQNTGQIAGLPANPRQWKKADVERLAKSIEETPELLEARPIIVMPHEGKYIVLGGNLRLAALKHLGRKDVPVYVLPEDTPIDKQKEIVIKDNGSFGEWDDLPLADWGVPSWETETQEEPEVNEDDFDEEQDEIHVRCQKGDIWQLGDHRLMCGDSTDLATVKSLMGGGMADISFTSPPYNAGDSEKLSGNTHFKESKYKNYDDDNVDYKGLILHSTINAMESAKYAFVNLQLLAGNKTEVIQFLGEMKDKLCDILIWKKSGAPEMAKRVCNSEYEFVFVFSNENNSRAIGTRDFRGTESNVFECAPQRNNEFAALHAATFSVEFVSHYITSFSNEGESVLDLFGGTGTTLIAAEKHGRKCYMMELDPHYCDVILARWEKFTGKEATKLN